MDSLRAHMFLLGYAVRFSGSIWFHFIQIVIDDLFLNFSIAPPPTLLLHRSKIVDRNAFIGHIKIFWSGETLLVGKVTHLLRGTASLVLWVNSALGCSALERSLRPIYQVINRD
jgi:hypothetical protein